MRPYALFAAAAVLLLAAGCTSDGARQPSAQQAARTVATSSAPASNPAVRTSTRPAPSSAVTVTSRPSATAPPASASRTPAAAPGTQQIVRRPVTTRGRVATGYTSTVLPADNQINCGGSARFASPSPVTVDVGPVACGPSVLYALACWNGPTPTTALCYRDPWHRQVDQLRTQGRLQAEPAPATPSPLGLVLSDGTRCSLRAGGAWASLDGHPELFGTYSCQGPDVIWGAARSDGIDRTGPLWKVWLAPGSGHGTLHQMTVRTAYFVGTARA